MSIKIDSKLSQWTRPISIKIHPPENWGLPSNITLSFCRRDFNRVTGGIEGLYRKVSQYRDTLRSQTTIDPMLKPFDFSFIKETIEDIEKKFLKTEALNIALWSQNKKATRVQVITMLISAIFLSTSFVYAKKTQTGALFAIVFTGCIGVIYKLYLTIAKKTEKIKKKIIEQKTELRREIKDQYFKIVKLYSDENFNFPNLINAFHSLSRHQDLNAYQKKMIRDTSKYCAYFFETCVEPIREKIVSPALRERIQKAYKECQQDDILKQFPKLSLKNKEI